MKRRFIFSALVCMLLTGTGANAFAATTLAQPVSAVTLGEPSMATTDASSGCARSESGLAAEQLPFFSPEPSARAANPCGACSDSPCKSVPLYSACAKRVGLKTYMGQCVEPYFTNHCPENYEWHCTCWVGEIP